MTPQEFVQCLRREKDAMLATYFDSSSGSEVATRIANLHCSPEHLSAIHSIVDIALTDTFSTILLGLDGSASLGGVQQNYNICDQTGAVICTGDGKLETLAHSHFQ